MSAATAPPLPARLRPGYTRLADWVLGAAPTSRSGPLQVVGYLVLAVLGGLIAFLRLPPGSVRILWAEDASIFTTDAYAAPWWQTVLKPYAGYASAYPRTIASVLTSTVNVNHIPLLVAIAACLTTGAVAAVVVWTLRTRLRLIPRLALWFLIVALPVAGIEVNGSIANSHWYLLIAMFCVLATRQRGRAGAIVAAIVVLVTLLTDPLGIIFVPLAVLRLGDPGLRRWWVPGAFVLGALVQLVVVAGTSLQPAPERPTLVALARTDAYRGALQPLIGNAGAQLTFMEFGRAPLIPAVFCLVVLVLLGLRTPLGGLALAAVLGGWTLMTVSLVLRWSSGLDPATGGTGGGARYSVVPTALALVAIVAVVQGLLSVFRAPGRGRRIGQAAVVVAAAAIAVSNLASVAIDWHLTVRSADQPWVQLVDDASASCITDSAKVAIGATPPGFALVIRCDTLEQAMERP